MISDERNSAQDCTVTGPTYLFKQEHICICLMKTALLAFPLCCFIFCPSDGLCSFFVRCLGQDKDLVGVDF